MVDEFASSPRLTLEAEKAVRNYVLKLAIIPSVGLAALSFAVGFGINEVARSAAYKETYSVVSKEVVQSVRDVSTATTKAETAKAQAEKLLTEVTMIKESATILKADVERTLRGAKEVDSILLTQFENLATKLVDNQAFRASLAMVSEDRFAGLTRRLESIEGLRSTLASDVLNAIEFVVVPTSPYTASHEKGAACPQGYVAIAPLCTVQGLPGGPYSTRMEASMTVGVDGIHRVQCEGGVTSGAGYTSAQAICARQKPNVPKQ